MTPLDITTRQHSAARLHPPSPHACLDKVGRDVVFQDFIPVEDRRLLENDHLRAEFLQEHGGRLPDRYPLLHVRTRQLTLNAPAPYFLPS